MSDLPFDLFDVFAAARRSRLEAALAPFVTARRWQSPHIFGATSTSAARSTSL